MAKMPTKPTWVAEAEKYLGLREIAGAQTAPAIAGWLLDLKAWWTGDETPWCGTFAAHCMSACGIDPPKAWYRAKEWAAWGQALFTPVYGCVAVFEREGGGHVGLVVGRTRDGSILVLGGNQGDAVRVSSFSTDRVLAYRWPTGHDFSVLRLPLPIGYAPPSVKEA